MGAGLSLTARCKDGAEVPVEISLSHILSRHGLLAVTFIHDVTERLRAERDLRDSEARYRSLFEQSNDALAVSVNGKYTQVNAAFARMFGYSHPEEFHGMSIYDTVPPDCRPAIQERRERRAGQQLRPVIYESRGLRRDGSQFVSEVRATDYWMEGRLHTLVILRDITAEREAEEALTRQAEALARSNADLQQFAYVTSHDLQEPLRSIASYAQLLERRYSGKLDEDADQFIGFLTAGVKRMQALIHDLLAFSRVANSDTVGFGTVDLRDALRWAEMNLQSSIQESGANVVCAALPAVRGDHIQLVQLLQNLLGNAIKYRSSAPPQIEIRAESRGEEWLFSVSDNGIGIPPEYHEHVFGLFRRLHTRDVPGTGIGLAICKRIVEKHGGRIWVESDGSSGSTFFFTLPAAAHRLP
jgi:PAS domain S-box-containing protein